MDHEQASLLSSILHNLDIRLSALEMDSDGRGYDGCNDDIDTLRDLQKRAPAKPKRRQRQCVQQRKRK